MHVAPKMGALLTESFELLSKARSSVSLPPSSRDPVTTSIDPLLTRQQLHDELFRYFLSVGYYIGQRVPGGKASYVVRPRLAIDACTSARARAALRAPKGKVPALSGPCQLDALTDDLSELRAMVSVQGIDEALRASFGDPMHDVFGPSSASDPSLGATVAAGLRAMSTGVGTPPAPVPGSTGRWFDLHVTVAQRCDRVVAGDLPFWPDGAALPIADLFHPVDSVERALVYVLTSRDAQQGQERLLPWGLALTAIARAYLVDLLVAFISVSWPIGRLYWEDPDLSDNRIPLFSGREKGNALKEKEAYNAYLAVALLEVLRGTPMAHVDPNPGDGYLIRSPEAPRIPGAGAVTGFSAIWADGGPAFHQQMSDALRQFAGAPIVVPPQERTRHGKPRAAPKASTVDAFVSKIYTPLQTFPSIRAVKSDANRDSDDAWATCGRFSAHLSLLVAAALARALGENTGVGHMRQKVKGNPPQCEWHTPKHPDSYYGMPVGSGSLRWGGNHPPHREHRDGLTFDIGHYVDLVPWAHTTAIPPDPKDSSPRSRSQPKQVPGLVVCHFLEQVNNRVLNKAKGVVAIKDVPIQDSEQAAQARERAASVRQRVQSLTAAAAQRLGTVQNFGDYDPRVEWADLVALPIPRDINGNADDEALRSNLVGHVALALAGVRKWVYASPTQHLFAVRAVAMLGDAIPDAVRSQVLDAEFHFRPEDHYDHWHVVFQDFTAGLGNSPAGVLQQWVTAWFNLGVDLTPAIEAIKNRKLANSGIFKEVVRQQNALVGTTEAKLKELKSKPASPPETSLVGQLAKAIKQASYAQVDAVTLRSKLLDRAAVPLGWKVDDWEVSSEADQQGEGIDLLKTVTPEPGRPPP